MIGIATALLAALGLLALAALVLLLADGVRTLLHRRRQERAARPLLLRVATRREQADLLVLHLQAPRRARLPAFAAGQHILLRVPAGPAGRILQRAYSLAAWTPRPHRYELGIKREPQGAASPWIWDHLKAGSELQVSRPRGHFVLEPARAEIVLIGGGIGITPMRAMLHAALASGAPRVLLWHAARTEAELLYREEFEALAEADLRVDYRCLLSRPAEDWIGRRGRLDAARVLEAVQQPATADFYMCAGSALMEALYDGLLVAGVERSRIRFEAFGLPPGEGVSGQTVALEDGREYVMAGEPSLLALLEAHDAAPASECRAGTCGQCRVRLLSGEVRWLLPAGVEMAEREILTCVCAPVGDVRLALAG
ncbi:2Fe-2S iron-sulfur cluster-binding protein [Methyloversatilis discipulorum]|uniref:2Fe-2S iron-sulfur cluster-binding protein n=1 Tax=Methyloversatilis discipulorum TaxID=1119528 RepID=UPI003F340A48